MLAKGCVLTLYVLYTANGTAKVKPPTHAQAITILQENMVRRVSIGKTIAVNRSYVTAHKLNTEVINKAPTTELRNEISIACASKPHLEHIPPFCNQLPRV